MQLNLKTYLKELGFYLFLAVAIGALIGELRWALILAMAGYILWSLHHALRLQRWLANPDMMQEPPESRGIWGELFEGIYRMQRRHLRAQDRQQTLFNRIEESTNSLRDGVIMTDSRGTLEWWNESAEHLLGLKTPADRGQPIHNLIRSPSFKHYFEAKRYHEALELPSPARPHIMLQFEINLFGDNDRLITVKDVTRIHHLEAMRRDFVSNVSHEMRTPLTVIAGYLETLTDYGEDLPPRWQKALNTMSQQSRRMEALITDLILLAKIETGDSYTSYDQETCIPPLLRSIEQDARTLSADRNHEISLVVEGPEQILGDESQLRSAFSNVIFNAVKYTPEGGRIDISWRGDEAGAHLSVRDTGAGIDSVHIPRLTERFYRADPSRHQDSGGTGLGLAIVKHVLLNHDGRLEIRSELGKGSEFICHFPPARVSAEATELSG